MGEPASASVRDSHRAKSWDGAAIHLAFEQASTTRPWTAGYRSFDRDRVDGDAHISGRWPEELRGTLYRNGPARHERGGLRYGHRWDGDGLVQRFSLSPTGVRHSARYVDTAKYRHDTAQGTIATSGFGTKVPGSAVLHGEVDQANAANIHVVPFNGELLALWEAGSAYGIDPSSLVTKGPRAWSAVSQGRPFSAHPRIEPDGTMWNFGVDLIADELLIYRIASDGRLIDFRRFSVDKLAPIHDFGVTHRHLVFLLPSLTLSRERLHAGKSFAEACQWAPELGMRILLVDKNDWSTKWLVLPPGCLFHVANAWEDRRGSIHIDYMRSEDPMSFMAGWSLMRGEYRHRTGARLTSTSIDPDATNATQETLGDLDSEFPVILPSDVGRRHELLAHLERSDGRPSDLPDFDTIVLRSAEDVVSRFIYGDDYLVEEHLFAVSPRDPATRWLIGTALDLRRDQTVLSVFDARGVGDGPVAEARLPYSMPLGLHGTYVAA